MVSLQSNRTLLPTPRARRRGTTIIQIPSCFSSIGVTTREQVLGGPRIEKTLTRSASGSLRLTTGFERSVHLENQVLDFNAYMIACLTCCIVLSVDT